MVSKITKRLLDHAPAVLALAAVSLPFVAPSAAAEPASNPPCPICGGGWDDYVELVGSLADLNIEIVVGLIDY